MIGWIKQLFSDKHKHKYIYVAHISKEPYVFKECSICGHVDLILHSSPFGVTDAQHARVSPAETTYTCKRKKQGLSRVKK